MTGVHGDIQITFFVDFPRLPVTNEEDTYFNRFDDELVLDGFHILTCWVETF